MLQRNARDVGVSQPWPSLFRPVSRCSTSPQEHISPPGAIHAKRMATQPLPDIHAEAAPQASWLPMVVIAMAQILMIFNISSLQVSIEGIASSFRVPATTIGTAIVTYSLVVAGLIMLGARVGQKFG